MRIIALLPVVVLAACASASGNKLADHPPSVAVAETALATGAPGVALQICSDALDRHPNDQAAMACQADALARLGRNADAEAGYQRLVEASPAYGPGLMGLGRSRLGTDPAAAEVLFHRAIASDPRNAAAWNDLGIACDMQGRHTEAQDAYAHALGVAPGMQAAQVNMALSLALGGRAPEALDRIRQIAADPSASPQLRQDMAAVLAMADRPEEAARLLQKDLPPDQVDQAIAGYRALPQPVQTAAAAPSPHPAAAPPAPVARPPQPVQTAAAAPSPRPAAAPPAPVARLPQPAQAAAAAPVGPGHIVLVASADTWMHVVDNHGATLMNRLMHAGDSWEVPAAEPGQHLYLTAGNAGATQVLIDGQAAPSLGKGGAALRQVPLDADALRRGPPAASATP